MTVTNQRPELERFNAFLNEGRIIRGDWDGTDDAGRETACLLAAFAPGIKSYDQCPAGLMPEWLARLTPAFDDRGSFEAWPAMIKRYGKLANLWHVLDDAAWERCLFKTLRECCVEVLPYDRAGVVQPVIALFDRWLAGRSPARSEWTAAAKAAAKVAAKVAAKAAAKAADAACAAARAAADASAAAKAADAAAYAAYAADARAADAADARAADAAAYAAYAAVWDAITNACLGAIELEIEAVQP